MSHFVLNAELDIFQETFIFFYNVYRPIFYHLNINIKCIFQVKKEFRTLALQTNLIIIPFCSF